MLKDLTNNTIIDNKVDVIADYDAFVVNNTETNLAVLYMIVNDDGGKCTYLSLYENGNYATWDIPNYAPFSDYFNDKCVIYSVDKSSIKFNDVEYKRNV